MGYKNQLYIQYLINSTKSGAIQWYKRVGQSCYTCMKHEPTSTICRYSIGNGQFSITFDARDKYGFVVDDMRDYYNGDELFDKLSELALLVKSNHLEIA